MIQMPQGKKGKVHHEIIGFRVNEWIVYRCSQCDYELHNNLTTHKVVIKNQKREITHSGTYQPFKIESTGEIRKRGLLGGNVH